MTAGGKRSGAGRRPALDPFEIIEVGAECEARWNGEYERSKKFALKSVRQIRELDTLYDAADSIPIDERTSWLASDAAEIHRDDVEGELRSLAEEQGVQIEDEATAPRILQIAVKRPKGVKAKIIVGVAEWASSKFHKPVSTRRVEACWKEVRKIRADLRILNSALNSEEQN